MLASGPRPSCQVLRVTAVLLFLFTSVYVIAAQVEAGQAFPNLLRGNERFGRKLLQQVHSERPQSNIVVSPISITLVFAAFQSAGPGLPGAGQQEIGDVFGWGERALLHIPSRMLLVAFEEPPAEKPTKQIRIGQRNWSLPRSRTWITNTVLYKGQGLFLPPFVRDSEKYFGMKFKSTGKERPTGADLARERTSLGPVPHVSSKNDFWVSSGTHFKSAWWGNTFSMSSPFDGEFRTASGQQKHTEMLTSELSNYSYAKTDLFEAASLPCHHGYMIVVLPSLGTDIHDVERDLVEHPQSLDSSMTRQVGVVTMPMFHILFETDFRKQLENMGVRQVFSDLGPIMTVPGSHLTEIVQKVDFRADRKGIWADAETVAGGIMGGIGSGQTSFHLMLNRPFLFLVRDQTTNTLLFLGAVMDPTQN